MPKFLRLSKIIEAIQHEDSDESALTIANWVNEEGGQATALFKENPLAPHHALVKLENTYSQNLALPGSWVVKMGFGIFYIVNNRDFKILFDPIENIDELVSDERPDR